MKWTKLEKHEEMETEMQKIFVEKKIRHEKIRSKSILFSDHGPRHTLKRCDDFRRYLFSLRSTSSSF